MVATVFIDGEAGTTGLQIRARLEGRRDVELIHLPDARRKDPAARADALNAADAVVLCLPDEASREAVSLIENPETRVVDASTAHRVADGWTYGFPELAPGQREAVAASKRIANPGCWPTGFLALVRPLVDAGLIPADRQLTVHGVSGYSGGGKGMIAEFEGEGAASAPPFRLYGLQLGHKHIPEMQAYARLARRPVFSPSVGRFRQGMLVEVPLSLEDLPGRPSAADLYSALRHAYAGERFVEVTTREAADAAATLSPEDLNDTNRLRLFVFGRENYGQVRLVAQLDNLGKGASGAAVQNLNLCLGLDEGAGLD